MMSTGTTYELLEIGVSSPEPVPTNGLAAGEVGYLITGVKDVRQSKVGDTITTSVRGATDPLAGYADPKPMVYSGLFPIDGSDYPVLRDALDKLKLNDAALVYEPETSAALGFGFRCGFLGLLHLEIVRERLEREAESHSQAELAIKQHISTDLKSLFRLARTAGIDREEFERIVKRELDVLPLLEQDN